jgi:hypothetical protein
VTKVIGWITKIGHGKARFGLAIAAYVRQRTKEAPAPLTATAEVYCGWSNSFRNLFFNA